MKVPSQDAPAEELDQLYDEFKPIAQQVATESVDNLLEYLEKKKSSVVMRAQYIKNIPGQARWLVKFRKGISDDLKAKCAPRNQHTAQMLDALIKAVKDRKQAILKECLKPALQYPRQKGDSPYKIFYLKQFALGFNQYVQTWPNFEKHVREQYKAAVKDEKAAVNLLANYLKDKEIMKDAPPDEYKKFKSTYETLVKDLG